MNRPSPIRAPLAASRERAGAGPHLALVAVQLIFGAWPVLGKVALRGLPSTALVALRISGAALCFLLLLRGRGRIVVPRRRDLARLALYSLLGVVLNQFLYLKGLSLSTVINATLLNTSIPVFTLLVSAVLGYERLSPRTALGTAVAAAGVVFLVNPLRANVSQETMLGNLLLVGNTAAYGAYIAVSQDVFRRYGALNAITWVFAFGGLVALPLGAYQLAQVDARTVAAEVWVAVALIILLPTVGAYYLNAWALERVAPSTVAVYIYLQPLIAFAVAPLFLGADEHLGARHAIATALIFAGVGVVTLRRRRPPLDVSEPSDAPAG